SLTEAGRVLWDEAEAILKRVDSAIAATRTAARGGKGELRVGYAPSPTARLLPATLRAFQTEEPGVRVLLHDLSTEEMLARLGDGSLEIALLVRPERTMMRGLKFEELAQDAIRVAVAPGHPFAKRRMVKLEEVARERLLAYSREGYPEYHESLVQLFGKGRKAPRIAEEHDGINSLAAAVAAGSGVALVSESVACLAGPRVKLIPISPAPKRLVIGAAWKASALTPVAEQFLKHARIAAAAP
ncbi:MAG TPA: LysR family substrate-binding domain-containing protein, partial [Opitutaceae bacterium]|nr:LysR family substrate-binding domain-containing protein [Opitutaceae bacterium]